MADKPVKFVGKHNPDCGAVKAVKRGDWNTPWGPIAYGEHGDPVITTERRYGRKGRVYRHWVRFVCNSIGCHAELHVEAEFIREAAERAATSTNRAKP